ncbi:glucokinase [Zoogloea sp.]|uniref:glucokinase n=1 Tax=Zoogloea sp. TaxID=49181 RepID=UPI0035B435DB
MTTPAPDLIGDIGGTNARFALVRTPGAPFSDVLTLPCADYDTPAAAIRHYMAQVGVARLRRAAIGIANPVTGDEVRMTNHHWSFSIAALRAALDLLQLRVLNDFTVLALALPTLAADELEQIGDGTPDLHAPRALIGAGTGLGISGLVPCGDDFIPLNGEGGHVTLAASDSREAEIVALLGQRFPHVSAERVLSGPGLEALYEAVTRRHGVATEALSAAAISTRGLDGSCAYCAESLEIFCAMLGTVAANLALVLGARGGVYIGGGIVPKLGSYFANSPFRARFEQKGRFSDYLARIPTYVIRAPYPGLAGAARALERDAPGYVATAP